MAVLGDVGVVRTTNRRPKAEKRAVRRSKALRAPDPNHPPPRHPTAAGRPIFVSPRGISGPFTHARMSESASARLLRSLLEPVHPTIRNDAEALSWTGPMKSRSPSRTRAYTRAGTHAQVERPKKKTPDTVKSSLRLPQTHPPREAFLPRFRDTSQTATKKGSCAAQKIGLCNTFRIGRWIPSSIRRTVSPSGKPR